MPTKALLKSPLFWIVAGMSVLCIALIVGALVFGWSTPDAGFMKYCKSAPNGVVTYHYTGDGMNDVKEGEVYCPVKGGKPLLADVGLNPNEIPWLISATGDKQFKEAVSAAVDDLNNRVGCALFKITKEPGAVVAVSKQPAPVGDKVHEGGATSHILVDGQWAAAVEIYNLVLADERHRGILHELGHVAGLAHDQFVDSLMYVGSAGTTYLTDGDTRRLKERYCEGGHQTREPKKAK